MQKITFVVVGKIKESFYREAVAEYQKRLSRFVKLEIKELAEGADPEAEADDILKSCKAGQATPTSTRRMFNSANLIMK